GARHEPSQRRADAWNVLQRACRHGAASGIVAAFGAYRDAGVQYGDARMLVEQAGRGIERAGRPPGVVVAEGDIGRAYPLDAQIAAGGAQIRWGLHQLYLGEVVADAMSGVIRAAV